jgi:hypothetical protein
MAAELGRRAEMRYSRLGALSVLASRSATWPLELASLQSLPLRLLPNSSENLFGTSKL